MNEEHTNTPTEAVVETTTEPVTKESIEQKAQSRRNLIIGMIAAVLLIAAGWWWFMDSESEPATDATEATAVLVDDEAVVATVNGEELYGSQLTFQMNQSAQLAGVPNLSVLDQGVLMQLQSQSLDAIVNTELLAQAAQNFGVEVSAADVESRYAELVENIGGEEAAAERLAALGITPEAFKETLYNDLYIEGYLEATTDETALAVTDVEIENFYAEATGGTPDAPSLEDVRTQIEQQLAFEKQQVIVGEILDELRAGADIELSL